MDKRHVFVLHCIKLNHSVSYPVMLNYKIFTIMKEELELSNLIVHNITDFLLPGDKQKIMNEKINYALSDDVIMEIYNRTLEELFNYIIKENIENGVIFGFHPRGFDPIYHDDRHAMLKRHKFKIVLWQDDLHTFNRKVNKDDKDVVLNVKFDGADLILSPSSKYYEHINSPYKNKSLFYFYCMNESLFDDIPINNFRTRKNKILLSGAIGVIYPVRKKIHNFYTANEKIKAGIGLGKVNPLYGYIDVLTHPGKDRKNNGDKTGLNYLKILASYKGAFFGHLSSPLDYPLAKVIEILASGTIGFFEDHPSYEEQLGLKKFVHYVPILQDANKNLIYDVNYYRQYLEGPIGEKIAQQGCKYVRDKFTMKNKCKEIVDIVNS
jgi:hypothetical protein